MTYNPMLGYLPTFTGPGPGPGTLPGALPPLPAGSGPSTPPPAPTPGNSGNSGNAALRRWMQQYGPVYQALMARQDRDGAGAGRESNRAPMGETHRTALNGFGMTPDLFRQITAVGGFIPGPVGWAMTGANIAGGLNNVEAVNAARRALGMPALDAGQTIGTTLGYNGYGKEGFVGDLNIGRETYGVSAGPRNGGGYLSGGLL